MTPPGDEQPDPHSFCPADSFPGERIGGTEPAEATVASPARAGGGAKLAWVPGLVVVGVTVVVAFVLGRHLWFFSDDWNIIAGWPSGRLLQPFNSHLSLVPIGLYQMLFHTFGLDSYVPYRVVGLASYALLGLVTVRFGLQQFGRSTAGALGAALVAAAVLWNEGGSTNVMFPFLLNFSLPIAAMLAVWWHLDRRTTGHDIAASALLMVAVATSGLGLLVVAAVVVELVCAAVGDATRVEGDAVTRIRRTAQASWRRWAILAPGPVLWFAWYLKYGVDSPDSGGLRPIVSYAARMLWAGAGSVTAGNRVLGGLFVIALVALAGRAAMRSAFDARLAGAIAAPLAFALLTAVSRIGVVPAIPPSELRYRWTIAAFLVFVFVLLLAANRRGGARAETEADAETTTASARPWAWAVPLVAGLAIAMIGGGRLLDGIDTWNSAVDRALPGVRANLWEAEAAAKAGVLDRDRALPVSYVTVTAGEYADAAKALGSPLAPLVARDYEGGNPESHQAAARAFVHDFGATLTSADDTPTARCPPLASIDPIPVPADGRALRVISTSGPVVVRVGLANSDSVDPDTAALLGEVADGGTATLTWTTPPPAGGGPSPVVLVSGTGAGVTICD